MNARQSSTSRSSTISRSWSTALSVREGLGNRVADLVETALKLADGIAIAENADSGARTLFSSKFACPVSGFTIPEIEPRLFSFNNPHGACPTCDGLGTKLFFDPELVIANEGKSLREGVIAPWAGSSSQYYAQTLDSIARHFKASTNTPWKDLPQKVRDTVLFGSGETPITMRYDDGTKAYTTSRPFEGVIPNMERRFKETDSAWPGRKSLSAVIRTRPNARPVTVAASSPRRWR